MRRTELPLFVLKLAEWISPDGHSHFLHPQSLRSMPYRSLSPDTFPWNPPTRWWYSCMTLVNLMTTMVGSSLVFHTHSWRLKTSKNTLLMPWLFQMDKQ